MKINRIVLAIVSVCATASVLFLFSSMEPDNFYVHLESNVKKTSPLQVGNTNANFVTRLSRRLNLTDEWEVGLTEISYKKSWHNILDDQQISLIDGLNNVIKIERTLSAGHYKSPRELIDKINFIISEFESEKISLKPVITYDEILNKVRIKAGVLNNTNNNFVFPEFSPFVSEILGLTDSQGNLISFHKIIEDYQIDDEQNPSNNPHQPAPQIKPPKIIQSQLQVNADSINSKQNQQPQINEQNQKQRELSKVPQGQKSQNPIQVNVQQQSQVNANLIQAKQSKSVLQHVMEPRQNEREKTTDKSIQNIAKPWDRHRIVRAAPYPITFTSLSISNSGVIEIEIEGHKEVSLDAGIHSLYVYCDIIKPVFVGDIEAPLLRRVEIPNNSSFADQCVLKYPEPQFHPLVSQEFDTIEIDIRDGANRQIDFSTDKPSTTSVTLHFRKRPKYGFESLYQLLR